jgi:hypothetical protein
MDLQTPTPDSRRRPFSGDYSPFLWIALFLAVTALLHYCIPYPIDDDTGYHFTVGKLIGQFGILHDFPWTPFSWQFDHYADKEFLFHLLFVPVSGLDFLTAERIVGIVGGTGILTAGYLVLRAEGVRLAGVWALLPLASSVFLFRFAEVRPQLLSITLATVFLWAAARQRLRLLALVALLFPLAYVAFWQVPLILLVACESARLLSGERLRWKPAATALAAIVVGVLLHPNTVNLLGINWIHMTDILYKNAWGRNPAFNLGNEFWPFSPAQWARFLVPTVLFALASLALAWKERRLNSLPLAFFCTALIFGILTVKTARFLEYFVPFSALALGVASRQLKTRFLAPGLLAVSLVYLLLFGTQPIEMMTSLKSNGGYIDQATSRYFAQQVPEGAQVFTCGWENTGNLMVALPLRRFIVAADPTLFYKKDPDLYYRWYSLPFFGPEDTVPTIRTRFKSRYVICRNFSTYGRFLERLSSDPSVKALYVDQRWVLFDLGAPAPGTGTGTGTGGAHAS